MRYLDANRADTRYRLVHQTKLMLGNNGIIRGYFEEAPTTSLTLSGEIVLDTTK